MKTNLQNSVILILRVRGAAWSGGRGGGGGGGGGGGKTLFRGKCDVIFSYIYTNTTTKLVLHLPYLVRLD